MSDITEDLKVGKSSPHKYVDNVETYSDKRNLMDMSDEKEYAERYEISKNYEETLIDVDEEYDEIYQIEESKEDDLESYKSETDERDQIENIELLKIIYIKQDMMMILLILILIWRQMMKNIGYIPDRGNQRRLFRIIKISNG